MESTLKIVGYQPTNSVLSRSLSLFVDTLEKVAPDNFIITVNHNIMDLGHKPGEMLKLIQNGTFDIGYISASYFAHYVHELYIFDLPFLINEKKQAYHLIDGKFTEIVDHQLKQKILVKLLAIWDYGHRHFTNQTRIIRSPRDCKGMALRTLLNELHPLMFKSLGFRPQIMEIDDFLSSLRAGEKIAQENALTNFYNFKLHKFHRYITLSYHLPGMALLIINEDFFENKTAKIKHAIREAAYYSTAKQRQLCSNEEKYVLNKLRTQDYQIHSLNKEERATFEKSLSLITSPYQNKIGKKIFNMLND